MRKKAMLMLLMGAVALCLMGCGEDEQAADTQQGGTTDRQTAQQDKGTTDTQTAQQDKGTVQPVPGGQGGTAGTGQPGGTAGTGQPGGAGTAADALAQQRNQYVQGAEQILKGMEQKLTALQQQTTDQADPAQQQKLQDLSKQVQTELADARAAVDKMRNATGTQLKEAKVAADQAVQDAEAAFKNLQSYVSTQVTQAQ